MASTVKMTTEVKGPFWKRGTIMKDAIEAAQTDAGREAFGELKSYLAVKLQNPTGAFQSRIALERRSEATVITDSGVVYGPWLEYGSRTRPTRFRGYTAFRRTRRRVASMLRKAAKAKAEMAAKRLN